MEKVNQRVVITKKMLKDGILRLLQKKSIEQINVTELCRESSINRATFYTHYQTPHDVLWEMEEELHQDLQNELQKTWKRNSTVNTEEVAEVLCAFIEENADLVRIFLKNDANHTLKNVLNKTYMSLLKQQLVIDMDEDDLLLISTYMVGGSLFILTLWMEGHVVKTPHEIAQILTKVFNDKIWS